MGMKELLEFADQQSFLGGKSFRGCAYSIFLSRKFLLSRESIFLCLDTEDLARELYQDLLSVLEGGVSFFPPLDELEEEILPPNAVTVYNRMVCLQELSEDDHSRILVTTKVAKDQKTLPRKRLQELCFHLEVTKKISWMFFLKRLSELGYRREEMVASRGEFAIRGDIVDIFPSTENSPVRVEFFDHEVESIRVFDLYNQRSLEKLSKIRIYPVREFDLEKYELVTPPEGKILDFFSKNGGISSFLDANLSGLEWLNSCVRSSDFIKNYKKKWIVPKGGGDSFFSSAQYFGKNIPLFLETIERQIEKGHQVWLFLSKPGFASRIRKLLQERGHFCHEADSPLEDFSNRAKVVICKKNLSLGFESDHFSLSVYTYRDFTGSVYKSVKRKSMALFEGEVLHHFSELGNGDYVVHSDYGISKFCGLDTIVIDGIRKEFLVLQFAGTDKVFVPITEVDRIHRFTPKDGQTPRLNQLNSVRWSQVKSKVREDLQEYAQKLLKEYALRSVSRGIVSSAQSARTEEFESSFEHDETRDQLRAIEEIRRDLESSQIMDRLLCGDVGFGKTEVAIRAAFQVSESSRQVAVLCPTTVLSQQHFQTFTSRLTGFDRRVAVLNRFIGSKEEKQILKDLKEHKIDILIGTHRLFSKDVEFADLGLLIIDEEQRFGVKHKERLREMKINVDTLTLSATPIPRTLHMSLGGVRAISVIHTPPPGRLPIKTFVLPFSESTIREAVTRELKRNGQVFYIYNRVETIEMKAVQLQRALPGIRIGILHGQMGSKEIEESMSAFLRREYDLLLATTIVESGMDIPNVNTILVERADAFGLAQLYQLRGRIGRRETQAYAYLFYQEKTGLSEVARKRLGALEEFTDLGSGFKIAMRDLEIRGAGNLLGKEQSGFLYTIGFDLYSRLLRDAIEKLKDGNYRGDRELPQVELRVNSWLEENYIPSYRERMDFFRRVSSLKTVDSLEDLRIELVDRYGPFTKAVEELFRVVRLRIYGWNHGVKRFKQMNQCIQVEYYWAVEPEEMEGLKKVYQKSLEWDRRFPDRIRLKQISSDSCDILFWLERFFCD